MRQLNGNPPAIRRRWRLGEVVAGGELGARRRIGSDEGSVKRSRHRHRANLRCGNADGDHAKLEIQMSRVLPL